MEVNILLQQLDYIFFFYGASFFVLGTVCFAILRRGVDTNVLPWWWLGLFGFIHGLNEWLDMIALSLGDGFLFKTVRLFVLVSSFVFLMEFARRSSVEVFKKKIGAGFYVVLFIIASLGIWADWPGLNASVRYCFGLVSGLWTAVIFFRYKGPKDRLLPKSSAFLLRMAGVGMFLYGLATGLVVPEAHVFPATLLNTNTFHLFFHLPVQFFRGIFAFLIATSIALYAIKQSMLAFIKEEAGREKRFMAFSLIAVISMMVFFYSGWKIVDYYGKKVEQDEWDSRHLKAKIYVQFVHMAIARLQTIQALAGSPELIAGLKQQPSDEKTLALVNEHLDRYRKGLRADVCYLMDRTGLTIASSNRNSQKSFVGKNYAFRPYFQEAMRGRSGIYLAKGVTSKERGIYVSYPFFGPEVNRVRPILGVAVAKATMDELGEYFRTYPYVFLVSPEGIIFVSSKPEWVFRSIRDITPAEKTVLRDSKQFGEGPWDNVGFEKIDEPSGIILFKNNSLYFASENIDGLPGWKILFMDDKSGILSARFMLIMIFLSFFLLIVILSLFIFRVSMDTLHIAASEALYEALVEGSPDCIQLFDREGRCISINKNGLEMLGEKKEEILGRTFEELWSQEYKEKARQAVAKVLYGEQQSFEAKMVRADGVTVIKSVTLAPILDLIGKIKYFNSIIRDITEERRARERLLQSSKMATVGALATGVSHEFNNVLEIILGNAELAYASSEPELMKKTLKVIIDSARRAAWIIKTMVDFSSKVSEAREFVDLGELIRQDLVLLGKVFENDKISVETHLSDTPRVYCNPGQLSQAFINIMMNARDAMRGLPEKKLTIGLDYNVQASEAMVCFKDTGMGLKEEIKDKLFGPFVTTKGILGGGEEKQPGAGLGLFVAYGIIKQHNGDISVESEEGRGVTFCISLPIFSEEFKGQK